MSGTRMWLALGALALGVAIAAGGCGQESEAPGTGQTTLEVLVPCGQIGPFSQVLELFQAENPGLEVEWVPENMVPIVKKIIDGVAHPDVFLTMGDLEADQIEEAGLIMEGTRVKYAENSLAIMVPAGNPAGVKTIEDLAKTEVKTITIPDPELNAVGKHAVEALRNVGIWEQVEGKVLFARFAADSKDAAAQGQAQASIGYYPCAVEVHEPGEPPTQPKMLKVTAQVAAELYQPFSCEGAVLKEAKNPEDGKKLLAFLQTPEAQDIFRHWQFIASGASQPLEAGK